MSSDTYQRTLELLGERPRHRVPKGLQMKRRILLASLMLILIAALTRGFFYLRYSIRRAREATLKADLFVIRKAIIDYTLEKNKTPQSMQDLMNEHYLKEIPTDPFTRKKDWVPITSDILLSPYQ